MSAMELPRSGLLGFSGVRACAALGLGVLAETLLYGGPVGWLYAVFVAALVAAVALKAHAVGQGAHMGPPLLLSLAGTVSLALDPNWAAFLLAFLGAASVTLAAEAGFLRNALHWMVKLADFTIFAPADTVRDAGGLVRRVPLRESLATGRRVAIGWGLPVLLASVFLALFALGNPLISEWLGWLVRTDFGGFPFQFAEIVAGVARVLIVALLCWPFLRLRGVAEEVPAALHIPALPFDTGTIIRSLLLFNIVFGAQNALDLAYLWGEGALPDHLTYAEYAHRGTYPLALASVLVGAFVIFAMPPGSEAERSPVSRWLVFLWLAQTGLLTLSCLKRLDLYVAAYSLTYLRVTGFVVTGMIGAGLVWVLARVVLLKSNRWLVNACVVTGLTGLYAGSVIDIGSRIAWFNVTHSRDVGGQGVWLDTRYLRDAVGVSAIPALEWYERNIVPSAENVQWHRVGESVADVRLDLTRAFEAEMTDWRAWTLRRWWLAGRIGEIE